MDKRTDSLNVVHHMNDFKSILSYATNIGFFLGAGTSCAFGLPSMKQLTDQVRSSLSTSSKLQPLFEGAEQSVKDLTGKDPITLEDILTYLREVRELTRGQERFQFNRLNGVQAKDLDQGICAEIFKVIKEASQSADIVSLRRFLTWYESANRGFLKEIYTTNYDMLLEMAMEANYTPYFDGFVGSYEPFFSPESIETFPGENDSMSRWIRLWKIHGSLNWTKESIAYDTSTRIIRTGHVEEPKNELMIYPSREKYNLSRKEPYVAYFDRLKKYLNRGELVFIVSGYSFLDEHINEIIYNALRNNNRLYVMVLCYEDEQVGRMLPCATSLANLCVAGPQTVITNGEHKKWENGGVGDKGVETYWKDGRFALGDFRSLIDFLVENSGRKRVIEEKVNAK